jgi:hypothetical protein
LKRLPGRVDQVELRVHHAGAQTPVERRHGLCEEPSAETVIVGKDERVRRVDVPEELIVIAEQAEVLRLPSI